MAHDVPSLQKKRVTNKIGRCTGISQLNEALVPKEQSIEVPWYIDPKSHEKCNREEIFISSCAMQRVIFGEQHGDERVRFHDAYIQKKNRMIDIQVLHTHQFLWKSCCVFSCLLV